MENIGKITFKTLEIFGLTIQYNPNMIIMTWLVMILLSKLGTYHIKKIKFNSK